MYSEQQVLIMKALYPDKVISKSKLAKTYQLSDITVINELLNAKLVKYTVSYRSDNICLTNAGKAYVEQNLKSIRRDKIESRRFWIPTVISIIALIKAFMPELTLLWELLTK